METLVEIKLPHQKPQIVCVRLLATGLYRLGLVDRFDRMEYLNGETVGFDITIFQTLRFPRLTRLVVRGDWEAAMFRNFEGQTVSVPVRRVC